MANNRLWLVNERTNEKVLLAKYYPTTGWYMFHDMNYLDDWFDKVRQDPTTFGDQHFSLYYDHVVDDEHARKANAKELGT